MAYAITNAKDKSIQIVDLTGHANPAIESISDSIFGFGSPTDAIQFHDLQKADYAELAGPGVEINLSKLLAGKMAPDATILVGGCNAAGNNGGKNNITQAISGAVGQNTTVTGAVGPTENNRFDWNQWDASWFTNLPSWDVRLPKGSTAKNYVNGVPK